jgi:IS30 family transposase
MDFEVREIRTAQGPKKLLRERETYFLLMQQGLSNNQACRIVGINAKTGRRWRNGRRADRKQKAASPVRPAVPPSGASRYLCEGERIYIADRLREKATVRAIASELNRSPSTVSREIRRNRHPANGQYRPFAAQARADARRPRPKAGKIKQVPGLRAFIQDRLDLRWSPEQICQALRAQFPDRPEMHVVHETVYQALYVQARGELRRGRVRRKPRRQPPLPRPDGHDQRTARRGRRPRRSRPLEGRFDHRQGREHQRPAEQYFPKSTDPSVHPREHLDAVAAELNSRPRKTLGWATPADRLHELTASPSNYLGSSLSQG